MAGDGGTADIGMQALSGALERGHDMVYVCYDNEAYMNTGIQRSSSTPYGASTTTTPSGKVSTGQVTWKKNMAAITAAHDIPYVAKGPAYVHILSVCPTGWRIPTEKAIWIGRLAVETGVFPLYEVVNGKTKISMEPEFRPVQEYLKPQGRFRHLTDELIETIQKKVIKDFEKLKAKAQA